MELQIRSYVKGIRPRAAGWPISDLLVLLPSHRWEKPARDHMEWWRSPLQLSPRHREMSCLPRSGRTVGHQSGISRPSEAPLGRCPERPNPPLSRGFVS